MTDKYVHKTVDGNAIRVLSNDTDGIYLEIRYRTEGSKHVTHHRLKVHLEFCQMKHIAVRFHAIMDELSTQWHAMKKALEGK